MNKELTKCLTILLRFLQSPYDHSLFIFHSSTFFLIALVYVDDVLLTGSSILEISKVKQTLDAQFTIKDLCHASYFLGMKLCTTPTGIFIKQRKYILDLLASCSFSFSNHYPSTPHPASYKNVHLLNTPCSNHLYTKLVGKILDLSLTRPDISFDTQFLSQFVFSPMQSQFDAIVHLIH